MPTKNISILTPENISEKPISAEFLYYGRNNERHDSSFIRQYQNLHNEDVVNAAIYVCLEEELRGYFRGERKIEISSEQTNTMFLTTALALENVPQLIEELNKINKLQINEDKKIEKAIEILETTPRKTKPKKSLIPRYSDLRSNRDYANYVADVITYRDSRVSKKDLSGAEMVYQLGWDEATKLVREGYIEAKNKLEELEKRLAPAFKSVPENLSRSLQNACEKIFSDRLYYDIVLQEFSLWQDLYNTTYQYRERDEKFSEKKWEVFLKKHPKFNVGSEQYETRIPIQAVKRNIRIVEFNNLALTLGLRIKYSGPKNFQRLQDKLQEPRFDQSDARGITDSFRLTLEYSKERLKKRFYHYYDRELEKNPKAKFYFHEGDKTEKSLFTSDKINPVYEVVGEARAGELKVIEMTTSYMKDKFGDSVYDAIRSVYLQGENNQYSYIDISDPTNKKVLDLFKLKVEGVFSKNQRILDKIIKNFNIEIPKIKEDTFKEQKSFEQFCISFGNLERYAFLNALKTSQDISFQTEAYKGIKAVNEKFKNSTDNNVKQQYINIEEVLGKSLVGQLESEIKNQAIRNRK